MKNIKLIYAILLLTVSFVSCEKDYNDWDVDPSTDRLFKSIVFEVSKIQSTAVEIKFTKAILATKYVFEFSKDSLEFNEIDKTIEILADTLTPFAPSTNQVKEEYRETFSELDGTTGYSVRMKAVDGNNNKESNYNQFYFETPAEQIFTGYTPTTNSLSLTWTVSPRVTNVSIFNEEMELLEDFVLTDEQKSLGSILIENLNQGTNYVVKIFNGSNNRGTLGVKTTGLLDSEIYKVLASDNAVSINTVLSSMVLGGATNITVEFSPENAYQIGGDITVPTGVNNIAFVGYADENGLLPKLENARFTVQDQVNDIIIQYLETTSAGNFLVDLDGKTVNDIRFEGSNISNINSIIRVRSGGIVHDITVSNCWISQTGGWGMLNVGAGNTVNSINVTNCTLTEISTRFADVRISTQINFKNITCVNINMSMGHLWRFDNNHPVQVSIQDCIITGPNGGAEINDTNGNYGNISILYTGSYKTNDLMIKDRPLNGITEIPLDIYGLFIDPANGDFHIQEGIGFAGTGVAGDKRWFN
tara:strand:- start:9977 stop:11569 length:1593 start_codon:yes stop_codon:yes gene_type:complete